MIGSKISRRYARALLSLGREDGNYEEYGDNLREFASLCKDNPGFLQAISNRIFPLDEREKLLGFVLDRANLSPVVRNFLRLLLDKNRIGAILEISDYYSNLTDEISNIVSARVTTARPLKQEALVKIEKALAGLTSKKIRMEVDQDMDLIGGIVVKIGDLVLDGSVRAQLGSLKESLKRGEYS